MRHNIKKKNSTKAERIMYEMLKALGIPFKHRWLVRGKEIDFVVGKYAIEIDGHPQKSDKNHLIVAEGLTPIHVANSELYNNKQVILDWLNKITK